MSIKRINLSFDLKREEDLQVYNILASKKYKTDYVIKAVLGYKEKGNGNFNREELKKAIKEALVDFGGFSFNIAEKNVEEDENDLPSGIFEMFNSL